MPKGRKGRRRAEKLSIPISPCDRHQHPVPLWAEGFNAGWSTAGSAPAVRPLLARRWLEETGALHALWRGAD